MEVAAEAAAEAGNAVACLEPSPPDAEKSNLWLSGVLSCMSSLLGFFGRADLIDEGE